MDGWCHHLGGVLRGQNVAALGIHMLWAATNPITMKKLLTLLYI
jgi:hypothetical protein